MPSYRYSATNPAGKYVTGQLRGEGRAEVEARLKADGFDVDAISEIEEGDAAGPRELSRAEVADLIGQLAALTRSGLPLPSGLRAAGEELASASLRSTFRDLADRIEAGEGLDDALAAGSTRFPAHIRGLILAGARSGRLADFLGEYVRKANLGAELRRRFWATLAYPLLTLVVVVVLVVFICHLSTVAVDSMFGDISGITLFGRSRRMSPQIEFLRIMARLISANWAYALLGGIAAVGVVLASARFGLGPVGRRRLACGMPVFGPLLRFSALTEFSHLLAMLIEAETPLPLALELAGGAVRDAELADSCRRMGRSVASGNPLSEAVRLWPGIPAGLGQLFRWSEGHRSLPESLHLAGEMFEARTRSQATYAANVSTTLLLLLILWWVGFAVASLYLPLITAIQWLSG